MKHINFISTLDKQFLLSVLWAIYLLMYSTYTDSNEKKTAKTSLPLILQSINKNNSQWINQPRTDYFFRQEDRLLAKGELGAVEIIVSRKFKKIKDQFEQCGDRALCFEQTSKKCTSLLARVGAYYLRAGFYDFAEIYADAAYNVLSKRILGKQGNLPEHVCLHPKVPPSKFVFSVLGLSSATSLVNTLFELGKEDDIKAIEATLNLKMMSSFNANAFVQKREFKKAKENLMKNGNSGFIGAIISGGQANDRTGNPEKKSKFVQQIEHKVGQELIARLDYVMGNYSEVIKYGSNERHLLTRALLKTRSDDAKLEQLINQTPKFDDRPEYKLLLQLEYNVLKIEFKMVTEKYKDAAEQLSVVIDEYTHHYKMIRNNAGALHLAEHPLFRSREVPLIHNIMRIGINLLDKGIAGNLTEKLFYLTQMRTAYSTTAAIDSLKQRLNAESREFVDLLRLSQDQQRKVRKLMVTHRYHSLYKQTMLAKKSFDELNAAQAELDRLSKILQNNKNEIVKIKGGTLVAVTDIQEKLAVDEALIVYVLLDKLAIHPNLNIFDIPKAVSYAWVITQNKKHLVLLNLTPSEIEAAKIPILSNMRVNAGMKTKARDAAHDLFKGLFEPLEKYLQGKDNISVITDGALDGLPLQMFLREKLEGRTPDYQTASFLVRDYAFSYLPSVSSFYALKSIDYSKINLTTYLGIGNPLLGKKGVKSKRGYSSSIIYQPDGTVDISAINELSQLGASAVEMENMSKLFSTQDFTELALENATESHVNDLNNHNGMGRYKLLLFSTHGLLAGEAGLHEPALVLTPPKIVTNASNNGVLTSSEVANLNLNADLVILSACNTGSGNEMDFSAEYFNKPTKKFYWPGAKPLEGLASAFFYAGAKSLLVTHWTIPDIESGSFTVDVVKRLKISKTGITLAKAVQQAQLMLLNKNTSPKKWAGFVVVGNGMLSTQ